MTVTEQRAKELIYSAHEAFNRRDIEGLLDLYHDDFTYWSNFGGPSGGPLVVRGKDGMMEFLTHWARLQSHSVPRSFRFEHDLGHAMVEFFMKDPRTGHDHSAIFRQVIAYRDDRLLRIEEFHDANALMAFIRIVEAKD